MHNEISKLKILITRVIARRAVSGVIRPNTESEPVNLIFARAHQLSLALKHISPTWMSEEIREEVRVLFNFSHTDGFASQLWFKAEDCSMVGEGAEECAVLIPRQLHAGLNAPEELCEYLEASERASALSQIAGCVIVLATKWGEVSQRSYSIGHLPGTIYIDWFPGLAVRSLEALVHESAHCLLNELLEEDPSCVEKLRSAPVVWSPWKEKFRPPFGLLHAAVAFSQVTLVFEQLLHNRFERSTHTYIRERMQSELGHLESSRSDIEKILKSVSDCCLRQDIQTLLNYADLPTD